MAMISGDWLPALKGEFQKDYYKKLFEFVKQEYSSHVVYPPADDIFNALHLTPLKDVKLAVKPSYYYQQNGASEKEIRTDNDGHYSVTLLPGLYGVTVKDNFYNDYFGGHLIYHTGATDTCYYDYNMRGWPCYGQWTGTVKSAWAWLSPHPPSSTSSTR